jgi:hypothetical protein
MPAGLDSIDSSTSDATIPYTAPKSTGLTEKIALDPTQTKDVLDNMQRFLDARESPLAILVGGLNAASAVAHGPQAYADYKRVKDAEDAQLMNYKTQMAAYKAAQGQAEKDAAIMSKINGGSGAGAGGSTYIEGVGNVSNSVLNNPYIKAQLDATSNNADKIEIIKKANAVAFGAQQKGYYEASGNTQGDVFFEPLGKTIRITPNQGLTYQNTGELPLTVGEADRKAAKAYWVKSQGNVAAPQAPASAPQVPAPAAPAATQSSAPAPQGSLPVSAIRTAESNNNLNVPDSSKGAQGAMQVLPSTAKNPGFGVMPARDNSPEERERVGRDYYAAMQKRYGNDTIAAIAYNWGPKNTDNWIAAGGNPNDLPNETKQYVARAHKAAQANAVAQAPAAPAVAQAPAAPAVAQAPAAPAVAQAKPATSSLFPTAAAATLPPPPAQVPAAKTLTQGESVVPTPAAPAATPATAALTSATSLPEQRAALQSAGVVPPKFSSAEEEKRWYKDQEDREKSRIAILEEEKKKIASGAGDRYNEMMKNDANSGNMITAANAISNIASNPENARGLGMSKKGLLTVPGALSNTIHALGAIGTLGHMSEKEANDWAAKTLPANVQDARDQLEKHAKDLGIGYAAQVFHGARMGIGLEKMAMESKGIGTEFSAATNKMHADIIKEGALFNRAKVQLWNEYAAAHGGPNNASFSDFEMEPKYRALEDQTRARLAQKYPNVFSVEDDHRVDAHNVPGGTPAAPAAPASKFDKYKK